jgi:hypothetical protein
MRPQVARNVSRRGIAVLLTGAMIVGVMTVVGLAVDVGLMYAVKTKLSAAADAAALAGARAIGGSSPTSTAQAYFDANIPQGYLLATNISATIPGPVVNGSVQTMTVTARATMPLLFMSFVSPTTDIKVSASAQRRNVNLVMVLDRSGSMGSGAGSPCEEMKAAAQNFTTQFIDGRDELGLIVFGGSYQISYPLSKTFQSGSSTINSQIASIGCGGNTGSAQAIWQAYQMLKNNPNAAGAINTIVFFTDGQPNGLSADWPIMTAGALGKLGASNTPVYPNSSGSPSGQPTPNVTTPWYLGYPASGCSASVMVGGIPTITGVIARNGEQQHGIFGMVATGSGTGGDAPTVSSSAGCAFAGNQNRVHEDVAYIPSTDTYGNKTTGYWDSAAGATILKIPAGPYLNQAMLDHYSPGTCSGIPCGLYDNHIDLASMNAAEDAAYRARTDATFPIMIFSIGLGGAQDAAPLAFLDHLSNTVNSDLHLSHMNEPSGQFIFVTGPGRLGSAFQQIASYVQRLSS